MNTQHRWLAALCLIWLTSLELQGCQSHGPPTQPTGHRPCIDADGHRQNLWLRWLSALPRAPDSLSDGVCPKLPL
jgi:hypothetical protein